MRRIKQILATALAVAALCTNIYAVDLYVDTGKIESDTPPTIVNGRTLVPVAAIFDALGATMQWDGETRTAIGTRGDITVAIPIGSTTVYVNGEPQELDVPAQIINNRTMVPAAFVSKALGCSVTWNAETQTAAVADKLKEQGIYVTKTGAHYHFDDTCNGGTYYAASLAEAMGRGLTPCDKCIQIGADSTPTRAPSIPSSSTTSPTNPQSQVYVGNKNTKKFHWPSCSSVDDMKEKNKVSLESRDTAISLGYKPCGRCHP